MSKKSTMWAALMPSGESVFVVAEDASAVLRAMDVEQIVAVGDVVGEEVIHPTHGTIAPLWRFKAQILD